MSTGFLTRGGFEIRLPLSFAGNGKIMTTYNTNLAAEFYVLSMLHRLGGDASLSPWATRSP